MTVWHHCSLADIRSVGRLDKLVCSDHWLYILPHSYYEYLCTSTSDHTPLLLHLHQVTEAGPRPFRFFNYWMNCECFCSWFPIMQGGTKAQIVEIESTVQGSSDSPGQKVKEYRQKLSCPETNFRQWGSNDSPLQLPKQDNCEV